MNNTIFINGVIGEDSNLLDVIRQFKSLDNPESVNVIIDSVGGYVTEGKNIYNYLSNLSIPVTTIAKNECYSIASYIFFAGDTKLMYADAQLMIHLPSGGVTGYASDIESYAKEMRNLEKELSAFYAKHLNLDSATVQSLLEAETFIDSTRAKELGIINSIVPQLKAVAKFENKEENNKEEKMTRKTFIEQLTALFKSETEEVMNVVIQDATGTELNFPNVEEGVEPQVGDVAEIDGKPADGEIVQVDGSTWVFVSGELTEIKPAESEEEEVVEEEVEEEANAETEEVEEEEFNLEAILEQLAETMTAKFKADNDALKLELTNLKKLIGSKDAEVSAQNNNARTGDNRIASFLKK